MAGNLTCRCARSIQSLKAVLKLRPEMVLCWVGLNTSLIQTKGLIKRFHSAQDRETWTAMRDKNDEFWSEYLNPVNDQCQENLKLNLPFGYGTYDQFWRYDPGLLLDMFLDRLKANNQYLSLNLDVNSEDELYSAIRCLDISVKTIVLAQGHQQRIWPSFPSGNPIQPKHGEYVIIECPDLPKSRLRSFLSFHWVKVVIR